MKRHFLLGCILILVFNCLALALNITAVANRIEGQVFSSDHQPLENIYVELRNEVESPIAQTKTDASGRFSFYDMPAGRYTIKVLPIGTNFKGETQEVYVTNLNPRSSDNVYAEFYLMPEKRSGESESQKSPEVIFVQEIPQNARKLYEDGAADLKKKQDQGLVKLEEAVRIFPDYFDALNLLGQEYIVRQNYEKAYPYLLKAIDVNPRSSINYFRLAYAFYQLKQYPAALKAAEAAVILVPDSIDAQQLYGTILRINGNFTEAEKVLLKADTLAKGKNPEVHWQLALLYNRLNRNQAAIDELETFLKLVPNTPDKIKIQELISKLKSSQK